MMDGMVLRRTLKLGDMECVQVGCLDHVSYAHIIHAWVWHSFCLFFFFLIVTATGYTAVAFVLSSLSRQWKVEFPCLIVCCSMH